MAPLALTSPGLAQELRLGAELEVNSYTTGGQQRPKVAMDADGDFVVVWHSDLQDGSGAGVFGRRFTSAGAALATEFQVNSYTTYSQQRAEVAARASGDFVVTWQQDTSPNAVVARRFTSAGVALATEFQVNTVIIETQAQSAVAVSASGAFVVAWRRILSGSHGIFVRRFASDGTAIGDELQVVNVPAAVTNPSISATGSGDFVVAWQQDAYAADFDVFGRRFASDGVALGTAFRVNAHTTASQSSPSVGSGEDGDFLVAWTSDTQDGNGSGVFARHFSSDGVALATELQVNSYTSGSQGYPAVTPLASALYSR